MQTLLKRRVVVLSGYGEFSRRVASGIAALPQAECVLGLPPGAHATTFAQRIGAPFMSLDPNEPSSLYRLLDGAFVVVNVRGPFAAREHLTIPAHCAAHGIHYIDPAESRDYFNEFMCLAREAREHDAMLVTGAGAAPAVTSILAGLLTDYFDRVNEISVFLTPGLGDQRELATARAVLARADQPMRIKDGGRWREQRWWERPQSVTFPAPVGRRRGYLCDLPDLDLLGKHFSARTVTAHAGFAPGLLNMMLATLAAMRRRGWVERLSPFSAALIRIAARATRAHANAAAVRVAMSGTRHGSEEEQHVAALMARNGAGPAIAAAPILALVRRWAERGVKESGAQPCVGLLDFADLKRELVEHDVVLVRQ